jgi:hypothetical protein
MQSKIKNEFVIEGLGRGLEQEASELSEDSLGTGGSDLAEATKPSSLGH